MKIFHLKNIIANLTNVCKKKNYGVSDVREKRISEIGYSSQSKR